MKGRTDRLKAVVAPRRASGTNSCLAHTWLNLAMLPNAPSALRASYMHGNQYKTY